ncbi:TetR/AcrR family transcriptional regulator; helix-turn-helix transcriptional regulator [Mycolicibacter heraklionensis]|uniref:TetR/AcrR family transcriptional regulator helix-turn-helix transcriptional regulator n=2 Tax=Mycolicibacter heraklionensis TaxID=512402 RepID=A0A9X7ZFM2_9MYCO|nr:TetR/AcrR family transcriptional regulator; helix-turn-helix transcriptional regulator [Mycolicibacter heraklionensis]
MEAIASKVGISAPALYRHYPSKYEMFSVVVGSLGQQLVDCTAFVDELSDAEVQSDAPVVLEQAVDGLITSSILNREASGLFRWQGRYLQPEDQAKLMTQMHTVGARLKRPISVMRPELNSLEQWTLTVALVSVAGSIIGHRLQLPDDEIKPLLIRASQSVVAAQLPRADDIGVNRPSVWRIFTPDAGPYEALLHSAVLLFGKQGYAETGVTEIADAVGVPASGVYRYFSSKSDILTTGLQRAVDRIAGEMAAIAGVFAEPDEALRRLIEAYVATVFANPELASVYDTERVNLAPAERELLRDSERAFIETWARPLMAVRPDLDAMHAKFLVHALAALVDDLGRVARGGEIPGQGFLAGGPGYAQACLRKLMESIVFAGVDEN